MRLEPTIPVGDMTSSLQGILGGLFILALGCYAVKKITIYKKRSQKGALTDFLLQGPSTGFVSLGVWQQIPELWPPLSCLTSNQQEKIRPLLAYSPCAATNFAYLAILSQ